MVQNPKYNTRTVEMEARYILGNIQKMAVPSGLQIGYFIGP